MKRFITYSLLFGSIIAINSSCSDIGKTYTCTCYGGVTGIPNSHGIVAAKRSDAKAECEKNNPPQLPANYYCELE